jgi:putative transposase
VHAELRLGEGIRVGRKRVERLMRQLGIAGVYRRRKRGCTRRDPAAIPSDDLVNRRFTISSPDRLWVRDITEHPTGTGKVHLGGARRVVAARRRLVDRQSPARRARRRRVADGPVAGSPT